jgi:hypothetical protein
MIPIEWQTLVVFLLILMMVAGLGLFEYTGNSWWLWLAVGPLIAFMAG